MSNQVAFRIAKKHYEGQDCTAPTCAEMSKEIALALREARKEALEEAAKRCEREETALMHLGSPISNYMADACKSCATGIRALADEVEK